MKIVKTANKTKITLSKKEWKDIGEKAGWMKSAAMDLPPDVQFYDDQFPKIPKLDNYFLIKEHQKWGYCPTYRNKDNKDDVLYYYEGKLWRWEELKEELKDTWRPASREEQDWFVTHLASSKPISKKAEWGFAGSDKFSPDLSFMTEDDWDKYKKNDKQKQQEYEMKTKKLRQQMREQDEEDMGRFKKQDLNVKKKHKIASKRLVAQEFIEKMMPGQTPYTPEEKKQLNSLIDGAANEEPSEAEEDDYIKRRRTIRVEFSDGDHLVTGVNGTKQEILDYYFKPNQPQDYDLTDLSKKRTITDVKFLA